MKKRIFALFTVMALLLSLVSCGAGGAGNDGAMAWAPSLDAAPPSMGSDILPSIGGENYTEIVENGFLSVEENPSSYFSIDASTASYPNLRNLINYGYTDIPRDAVRIEEMLNYFDYNYKRPVDGQVLGLDAAIFDTPYNGGTKLLTLGLAAEEVEMSEVRSNIVFLIDVSGSMAESNKLPLVQEAFGLLTSVLNPEDRISVVTYAGRSGVALEGAYGHETEKIQAVIDDLMAGGSTAGSEGISTAYAIAEKYFIDGGNNRVILATDGDFNVGVTGGAALGEFISQKRDTGVYLSVFGVGRGNLNAETAESLALAGNGAYSYIDSVREAERALVEGIGGSIVTVAKDVKAGITFDPEYVKKYRLIGYENKLLTEDEFEDEATDAGEIGSGHTLTVVYEIELTEAAASAESPLAEVIIRYKPTENSETEEERQELRLAIGVDAIREATDVDLFVAGVVEFGLILRESSYAAEASLDTLTERLHSLELSDEYMIEFCELVSRYAEIVSESGQS